MNILLNNHQLDNFEMKNMEYLVTPTYYNMKSGTQEYRLYSYISTLFNNITILDLGTSHGTSALSLSHNINNKVITYDIVDCINNEKHIIYSKPNIEFRIKNILEDLTEEYLLDNAVKVVMIDIDHYGGMEKKIIDRLYALKYSGIILLDDVFHHPDNEINKCMNDLWNNLEYDNIQKIDITKYAHWSGTGIILMNTNLNILLE
jgi:predicted O-methyltransferase YrrM